MLREGTAGGLIGFSPAAGAVQGADGGGRTRDCAAGKSACAYIESPRIAAEAPVAYSMCLDVFT